MSHTYDVRIFAEFKATFDIIILIIYAHNFYTATGCNSQLHRSGDIHC